MRQIGSLTDERQVQRAGDYFLTLGIHVQVEKSGDGYVIWAIDEDRVAQAREELKQFVQNPDDERYLAAEREAGKLRGELIRKEMERRGKVIDVRQHWTGSRARPLTILLIIVCCAVGLVTKFDVNDEDPVVQKLVIAEYRISGNVVRWQGLGKPWNEDSIQGPPHFQFWRLVTPIFLHIGPVHLLMNMMAIQSLGTLIEARRGPWRMAMMILVIAVLSNLAQYAYSGPSFAGISGVAFGLFGYAWIKSEYDPNAGIAIPSSSVTMMLFFLVLCMTGLIGPVANAAHVVGLITGILLGYGPVAKRLILGR